MGTPDLHPLRAALSICVVLGLILLTLGGSYAITRYELDRNHQALCTVIALEITAGKPPLPPHPTRLEQANYDLYLAFAQLAREYNCAPVRLSGL